MRPSTRLAATSIALASRGETSTTVSFPNWTNGSGTKSRTTAGRDESTCASSLTMSSLTRVRGAADFTITPVKRPPWLGWEPRHLDEYRGVGHHAVGPGCEEDRTARVPRMPP